MDDRIAVVTGASSGIGAATARLLRREGMTVWVGARREERLRALAGEIGARPHALDVTDPGSVAAFCEAVGPVCHLLVNNAGGARGFRSVAEADDEEWRWMFEANVLGAVRVTRGLLPALRAGGDGHVVNLGSIAGHEAYPGGGGYNAAKFAVTALSDVLRQELLGEPIRVTQVDPGMVDTEFSVVRFGGDEERAAAVYAGMTPLAADDVADAIVWATTRPSHVNVDAIRIMARDQYGAKRVHRRMP